MLESTGIQLKSKPAAPGTAFSATSVVICLSTPVQQPFNHIQHLHLSTPQPLNFSTITTASGCLRIAAPLATCTFLILNDKHETVALPGFHLYLFSGWCAGSNSTTYILPMAATFIAWSTGDKSFLSATTLLYIQLRDLGMGWADEP